MEEVLQFHFEGKLSDDHKMNFYEVARFQYAAARLLVKLCQFRDTGSFTQKITSKTNSDIRLTALTDGSFNINVEELGGHKQEKPFLDVQLSDLVAYVSERVIDKMDDEKIKQLAQSTTAAAEGEDGPHNPEENSAEVIPTIAARTGEFRRRQAELDRENRLLEKSDKIAKIDFARSQKLIAMAAPLVSEMATALRTSADTLEVSSTRMGKTRKILYLDQKMAEEIETAVVDSEVTPVLGDITQFNKDNGWGKIRLENSLKILSFSIPYDLLGWMKERLIESMKKDIVHLQTYFIRDKSGEVIRLIAVGILPTPKD